MSLYRLSMRTISRGRGELAVATAAYIAGERLYLESEHWTYDWSWRAKDVIHTELIGAHGWSREELWNEAEWAEARWDGVTAREIILALPCELALQDQVALAREFAESLHAAYGVAVDLAVHMPDVRGGQDERNVHAHLLVSTRVMSRSGLGARTTVWDHARTGGPELRLVRTQWRRMYNAALERAGIEARVDERSYRDQGLERLPGVHLGPVRSQLEREGTPTAAGDYNRSIAFLNRLRHALGRDLPWDWSEKSYSFSDEDGYAADAACRARLFLLAQAEEALKQDPGSISVDKRREIRAEQEDLAALRSLLRPCTDATIDERVRRRTVLRQSRKRARQKEGLGRGD